MDLTVIFYSQPSYKSVYKSCNRNGKSKYNRYATKWRWINYQVKNIIKNVPDSVNTRQAR